MFGWLSLVSLTQALNKIIIAAVDLIGPIGSVVSKAIAETLQGIWNIIKVGVTDILDNWKTLLTCAILMFCAGWYGHNYYHVEQKCSKIIKQLHKDYKFVPRKNIKQSKEWDVWGMFR